MARRRAHPTTAYARAVKAGKVVAGKYVRLACERHLRDLKRKDVSFDGEAADRAIGFFPDVLRLTKGEYAGQPFELQPWQEFIVGCLFGWKRDDGLRRFRSALILVGKKNGKCIAPETPVTMASGSIKSAEDVVPGDLVMAWAGGGLRPARVSATETQDPAPGIEIETARGRALRVTEEHPFLVRGSRIAPSLDRDPGRVQWVQAKDLRLGDRVVVALGWADEGDGDLSLIDAYALGAWIGDGDGKGVFTTMDTEILKRLPFRPTLVGPCAYYMRGCRDFLRDHGLAGCNSRAKKTPRAVTTGGRRAYAAYLSGYLDTDGSVSGVNAAAEWYSVNHGLLKDCQHLLSGLGINAQLTYKSGRYKGKKHSSWRLVVRGHSQMRKLAGVLDLAHPEKRRRLLRWAKAKAQYEADTFSSDRVSRIEKAANLDSVAIEVEGLHTHVTSGLVTHNSEMMAGLALYGLVADGELGAEVYSAATTRDQASLVWRAAKRMRDLSPELREHVGASNRRDIHGNPTGGMWVPDTGSTFFPLGRDKDTMDGINPHLVIIDELHRHKSREVFDVLTASNVARRQPLAVSISTAGAEAAGVCWEERAFAIQVLEGSAEKDDFFAYLAEIDEKDDWKDPDAWPKANPNLGVSITAEALRGKYQKAKTSGPDQAAFIRYHGNRYTADPEEVFIMPEVWSSCSEAPEMSGPCFAAVDLSARTDWCAAAMYWTETHSLDWKFWLPEEDLEQRAERDRVPIKVWAQEGLVDLHPGPVVDDRQIRLWLTGIFEGERKGGGFAEEHEVVEVVVDRWGATRLLLELTEDGLTVVPFGQGYKDMSPASREFEALALGGKLRHGDHPIAKWMIGNTRVTRDPHDNIKPVKVDGKQGRRRIDGIVAAIMAVGRAAVHENPEGKSVYDERGAIWVPG